MKTSCAQVEDVAISREVLKFQILNWKKINTFCENYFLLKSMEDNTELNYGNIIHQTKQTSYWLKKTMNMEIIQCLIFVELGWHRVVLVIDLTEYIERSVLG